MDQPSRFSISASDLYSRLGTAAAPLIVDVRQPKDFDSDTCQLVGAIRRAPADAYLWRDKISKDRRVVLYCQSGGEISVSLAATLQEIGFDAHFVAGGMAEWQKLGLPTRRRLGPSPSQWVTRERPKVDRIACPWLVRRFIDPDAAFFYMRPAEIPDFAAWSGAIPYDVDGAEFGHVGEFCSFDAFLRIFAISDSALDRLALIVRGADTGKLELTPQSPGLFALSHGLSATIGDDHDQLELGMLMYDALYAWCRQQQDAPVGLPSSR